MFLYVIGVKNGVKVKQALKTGYLWFHSRQLHLVL